jgi:large subunit ribosomal protein L18|tara:strand:+ start:8079 stop:8429 length:351 start_codon:yes stop_codon:yes gene_type:complete
MKKTVIERRVQRIRRKLKRVNRNRFRLSVHRSSKNIFAQIIDDKNNKTIVSASSIEKSNKQTKVKKIEMSNTIAELLAKRALEKKITEVFFDRGKYKYHGRIKVFAEMLRKNGLNF